MSQKEIIKNYPSIGSKFKSFSGCKHTAITISNVRLLFLSLNFYLFMKGNLAILDCGNENKPCQHVTTNPFHQGCLYSKISDKSSQFLRVCNSDDPVDAEKMGICRVASIQYPEVRIIPRTWESANMLSWLLQIFLSELLDVPTTIETGSADVKFNFYEPNPNPHLTVLNEEAFDIADALSRSAKLRDCTKAKRQINGQNEPCAHFTPEVWMTFQDYNRDNWKQLYRSGAVTDSALGLLGFESWFVTKYTVKNDPTLVTYLGLQGEENRRKLADTFLRPTTWGDYCQFVSNSNCAIDDGVARRPPQDETESKRYFVESMYTGHFRKTERNNCDKYPNNCTGHFADYPCGWESYFAAQSHYLGIALESDGPDPVSHGYPAEQLQEIMLAANATKSNLMLYWFTPEPTLLSFLGTDSEYIQVNMPTPTQKCYDARPVEFTCAMTKGERIGKADGVCVDDGLIVKKLFSKSLIEMSSISSKPVATLSPAYGALDSFTITKVQLTDMFGYFQRNANVTADPRDKICSWAFDNMEYLKSFIPNSFPRVVSYKNGGGPLFYASVSLGAITTFLVLFTGFLVHRRRQLQSIINAQIDFLWLLLTGSLLIALGVIVIVVPVSDGTCVAGIWLVNIGYSLELVPMIVKVAAIQKIASAAQRFRRVVITRKSLFGAVAIISAVVVVFLLLWTIIDTPKKDKQFRLSDTITSSNATVVTMSYYCSSESDIWMFIAVGWNFLLLFLASILAFQTRLLQKGFNESHTLAFLIYSHFLFVVIRLIIMFLSTWDDATQDILRQSLGLNLSIDTITTLLIYFAPKFRITEDSLRSSGSTADTAAVAVNFGKLQQEQ
jgi:hypothetical protein